MRITHSIGRELPRSVLVQFIGSIYVRWDQVKRGRLYITPKEEKNTLPISKIYPFALLQRAFSYGKSE